MLTKSQERFLAQRKFLSKFGFWSGIVVFFALVLLVVYMYFKHPLLANPYYVIGYLETNSLPTSTLSVLATIGSLFFLTICSILGIFILFFLLAVRNERKLIKIIDILQKRDA
jgi:hypothetical protein